MAKMKRKYEIDEPSVQELLSEYWESLEDGRDGRTPKRDSR